jgi:hypothetical protein
METYRSHLDFCAGTEYQQWLAQHLPPATWAVDRWFNSEHEVYRSDPTDLPWLIRDQIGTRWQTRIPLFLADSVQIRDHRTVDIGGGTDWLQRAYPNITRVDPIYPADQVLTHTEWWQQNSGQWPRVISINALHYRAWSGLEQDIARVRALLTDSGRAVITVNRSRLSVPAEQYHTLEQLPGVDRVCLFDLPADAFLDGNVWIWLSR